MSEQMILFDVRASGVATLTLNRPEKYNAFTPEMIDQWEAVLRKAASLGRRGQRFDAVGQAGAALTH